MIIWNEKIKLIISDVDDTIAPSYQNATEKMVSELEKLLVNDVKLLLISGQSIKNIISRVVRFIAPELRKNILVAQCNGAEVYRFLMNGMMVDRPVLSILDKVNIDKAKWHCVMREIRDKFDLTYVYTADLDEFKKLGTKEQTCIMVEDRHVEISMDFVNGVGEKDIRIDIVKYAKQRLKFYGLNIVPQFGGNIAIDFNIQGVSKGLPIKQMITFGNAFDFNTEGTITLADKEQVEIWGDSFSLSHGSADLDMCKCFPKEVRTISFRKCKDIPEEYNIQIWEGKNELAYGLQEYLESYDSKCNEKSLISTKER